MIDKKNMNPKISIIIPCNSIDMLTLECIDKCKELEYDNFEIIVLPDFVDKKIDNIKIISTDKVSPGRKRNIGIKNSEGEFLAFIDSDAYPRKDWLISAIKHFGNTDVIAVGGPGITPETDNIMQKAGGYILSSPMVGELANRFKTGRSVRSDDIHSCNFIARRAIIEKIGGWNEKYWPGEDTLICLAMKKLGDMIESPDVVVYHHRRPLFTKHLKQISRFGKHRGHFVKRFPETSFRLNYFVPSIFTSFMISGGILMMINRYVFSFYVIVMSIYIFGVSMTSIISSKIGKDLRYFPLVFIGTISTHIVYGLYFIQGLLARKLER